MTLSSRKELAEYIYSQLEEMALAADKAELRTLGYLLEVAKLEARAQAGMAIRAIKPRAE